MAKRAPRLIRHVKPPAAQVNVSITGVESLLKFLDARRALHDQMRDRKITFDEAARELDRIVTTLEGEELG